MIIPALHPWTLTPTEAVALQRELACRIDVATPLESCEFIAGTDCSYNRFSPEFYAAVVVLRVSDDGQGMNLQNTGAHQLGLRIMRERAEEIGAAFTITSERGAGTKIVTVWQPQ